MFSIDQNCSSLWDPVAKLHALAGRGVQVMHFVEDIDVAFTSLGSGADAAELKLDRERFHHSGGAYWGPALFYCEFLGRLPVDVRDWECFTGMKTAVLAKRLGRTVENLFGEFSPSDNWQLIGPSYVGDSDHHRIIGDLSVAETGPFLGEIMDKAQADCRRAFPDDDSQQRLTEWFARERKLLADLLARHAQADLADLYIDWMAHYVGQSIPLARAAEVFATGADPDRTALLELFLRDYDLAAGLYNQAIAETHSKLRPLRTGKGELPFFAVLDRAGHRVRTGAFLEGGDIRIGDKSFRLGPDNRLPVEAMLAGGVRCLAGKAIVLVIQLRLGAGGAPLVLPYRGSEYMPAAHRLGEKLTAAGLLPAQLHPLMRVRFRLLDRIRDLRTTIRLPGHLAEHFGAECIPAAELGEKWAAASADAAQRLQSFKEQAGRQRWQEASHPKLTAAIDETDARRRKLAAGTPDPQQIRPLWNQAKALQTELLEQTLRQIARDWQLSQIDYWDSRGALLPWCLALGGEAFYDHLIAKAELYEEPP